MRRRVSAIASARFFSSYFRFWFSCAISVQPILTEGALRRTVHFRIHQCTIKRRMILMQTVTTSELELMESWIESDPERGRVRPAFPINRSTGSEGGAVVYFEIEPGKYLPRHTDSPEEILYIVAGT